jgi:hypothetical protein
MGRFESLKKLKDPAKCREAVRRLSHRLWHRPLRGQIRQEVLRSLAVFTGRGFSDLDRLVSLRLSSESDPDHVQTLEPFGKDSATEAHLWFRQLVYLHGRIKSAV